MPQIVIDVPGLPKADIIKQAYGYCGLSETEYEISPEEMVRGLRRLNALMAVLKTKGIVVGYDFPTYAQGLLEEPSGVPDDAAEAVCALLARRLAPTFGGSLTDDAKALLATAEADLYANYAATPPTMSTGADRLPSSGVRHRNLISLNIDTLDTP